MSHGEVMQKSLKTWLEEHLPAFLNSISEDFPDDDPWELPVIEDYVLVVAVKDFKDGQGGIFSIGDSNVPGYRIRGLLTDALHE
jgi:hypothetical protein